jgi:hypothetical protein
VTVATNSGGLVDANAQTHLAELISFARIGPPSGILDADEWRPRTFGDFSSAVAAFKAVGAITPDEAQEWTNRMLVALGEEPLTPAPPGTIRLVNVAGKKQPPRKADPPPESHFLALVPVDQPDRPLDYGGRLQILGVELYGDAVTVNWRLAPEPDYELVFAEELASQELDLDGLPEDHRKLMRSKLIHRLQMQRRHLGLSDDLGTEYFQMSGGSSGGPRGKRGHTDFVPPAPAGARSLTVTWDVDTKFEVLLTR